MKFPKVIFITQQDDGDGSKFLTAHKDCFDVTNVGETIEVGVYQLQQRQKVTGTIEVSPIKSSVKK